LTAFVSWLAEPDASAAPQQEGAGSIRGVVRDKDFDTPVVAAQVTILETGRHTLTADQGHYVFSGVAPGRYTLVFTKDGFARQVTPDVVVFDGRMTDVDASLASEFVDLDEFVVEDFQLTTGSEAALLQVRFESAALMDSIGAELMSRAGASDAASALRLVAGASVQGDKYAVIRGLPDRYVNSQMNGVRLPTADENKRAVQLDQFPAAVVDSIRVSKTFTPDQQGDASGGAVDVRLKGAPDDEFLVSVKMQGIYNTQVRRRGDFLSYDGGGVSRWGKSYGERGMQLDRLGANWNGAVGTSEHDAPANYKSSIDLGGRHDFGGFKVGGLVESFYEHTSTYYADGKDDSFWVEKPGAGMVPHTYQGTPTDGDFKTGLYDVTRATDTVKWGGLATAGIEWENHSVAATYLYTRAATDAATLATDTRGKQYFFPNYDPNDPNAPGNTPTNVHAAPYLRVETLDYTERTTGTLQFTGRHSLMPSDFSKGDEPGLRAPEFDWRIADSDAQLFEPDKRQFGGLWLPPSFNPGVPPAIPPSTSPPTWLPYKPAQNFTLGNLQRIWKEVDEHSREYALDLKCPFKQWNGRDGYVKYGWFDDVLVRRFNQDSFSNFSDNSSFIGGFDDPWSAQFPFEDHPITASKNDVDYHGEQQITAYYGMADLPLTSKFKVVGGVRRESTAIGIVNVPESLATWFPPGATAPVQLNPGDADVTFRERDTLPALELVYDPFEHFTARASYSETLARQTFKELTPIVQQEYLGGPIFIGNPALGMSHLRNYDLRFDWTPEEGSLVSVSFFRKDVYDPIEYVQRIADFTYTTAVNYPSGTLTGHELELRQGLGSLFESLDGVSLGANATFLHSSVTLPADEAAQFDSPAIQAPMHSRDMTGAPDHLYNLFLTYEVPTVGTKLGLVYSVVGDTLVAGAGISSGLFVPNVYAREYDTLNLSVSQPLGKYLRLDFQAKNLTDPRIVEVYRSKFIGSDVTKTSYTKGIEYSVALVAQVRF
jgi:outer membrane receptor protein involved in Fe transport